MFTHCSACIVHLCKCTCVCLLMQITWFHYGGVSPDRGGAAVPLLQRPVSRCHTSATGWGAACDRPPSAGKDGNLEEEEGPSNKEADCSKSQSSPRMGQYTVPVHHSPHCTVYATSQANNEYVRIRQTVSILHQTIDTLPNEGLLNYNIILILGNTAKRTFATPPW